MEDRYLFRAKHSRESEKWHIGNLVEEPDGLYLRDRNNEVMVYIHDPSTICQCTGLRDKSGNLIWENDILMCNENREDLVTAVYGEFAVIDAETLKTVDYVIGWHYEVIPTDELSKMEPFCLSMPLTDACVKLCKMEVIGNIFDNMLHLYAI